MNPFSASLESFGREVSHAWDSCTTALQTTCSDISEAYELGKQKIVQLAREKLPEVYVDIVERILNAIPDVFVALAALFGGSVLVIPTLIVGFVRRIPPMMPIIQTIFKGQLTAASMGKAMEETLKNFGKMFDENIAPALLVASSAYTLYCFTMGMLFQGWRLMLMGTIFAIPVAWLSLTHIQNLQRQGIPPVQPEG